MTSDARRAANRENAKKSTGPRTQEGKERSRANAFKHGRAGAGVVVEEELRDAAEAKADEWVEATGVQGGPEEWLVRRAAVDATRLEAVEQCERARLEARVRRDQFYTRAEGLSQANADFKGSELFNAGPNYIASVLVRLKGTASGCDWMIRLWQDLLRKLRNRGGWTGNDFFHVKKLLGWHERPTVILPEVAAMAVDHMLCQEDGMTENRDLTLTLRVAGWEPTKMLSPGDTPGTPESIARACIRLSQFIEKQIQILSDRRDLLAEVESIDAAMAADRLLVDTTAEGKLLHRYATELLRRVHQSLDHLAKLRPARPEPASPPVAVSRNEANVPLPRAVFPMQPPLAASSLDDATTIRVLMTAPPRNEPNDTRADTPENTPRNEPKPIPRAPQSSFPPSWRASTPLDAMT